MFIVGIIVYPLSEFSFYLKAMSKMYLVQTSTKNLFKQSQTFKKPRKHKIPARFKGTPVETEALKHHFIKLSFRQKFALFFKNLACWFRKDPFKKLYGLGTEIIEKDLNIEKLIRSYKDIKAMLKEHREWSGVTAEQYSEAKFKI